MGSVKNLSHFLFGAGSGSRCVLLACLLWKQQNHHVAPIPSVPVGMSAAGPTPQIKPDEGGSFGENQKLWVVSPKPNWDLPG